MIIILMYLPNTYDDLSIFYTRLQNEFFRKELCDPLKNRPHMDVLVEEGECCIGIRDP